ncbi:septum site-determining protein MinC [Teichococcus vastitatis]|uniref:septum site-determining protein MinC n=1 Tax=Teichococcus vastitatis TaxID=2307076 RepID=UPI0013004ADB|nr:septum site-determining protein MinC [Pseudoroseomonas vastitatis]
MNTSRIYVRKFATLRTRQKCLAKNIQQNYTKNGSQNVSFATPGMLRKTGWHRQKAGSMTSDTTWDTTAEAPIRLRGRAHALLTLEIADLPTNVLQAALSARLGAAAGYFRHAPVLLNLNAWAPTSASHVTALVDAVRSCGLVPAAFRARWPEVERAALACGLGRMLDTEAGQDMEQPCERRPPLIISEPVRSGQRIYAAEADLIVLHSVSPGAQLLADGCIHVYGALRGAASAGVGCDTQARIFAKIMDAELLSIAGLWLGAEDIPANWQKCPAQLRIDEGWLRFAPLP